MAFLIGWVIELGIELGIDKFRLEMDNFSVGIDKFFFERDKSELDIDNRISASTSQALPSISATEAFTAATTATKPTKSKPQQKNCLWVEIPKTA